MLPDSAPPLLSTALRILLIVAGLYGLFVLLAWRFQNRLAFPAPSARLPEPRTLGIPDGKRVEVSASDGVRLKGWYLPPRPPPPRGERAPGLIWFYGNMETVAGIAPILREFRPPGIALLALDYRGYGESGGTATERGLYRDAEAAWTWLTAQPDVDSARIAVYGRSLGSAVALHLATHRLVRVVVLESPFSSAREMAREHYALVPPGLVHLSLDNVERARRLTVPLLVFHGTEDAIAPLRMGRAVAEAGRAEELVLLEGSGHNDTYEVGGAAYRDRIHRFLAEHLRANDQK